MAIVYQRLNQGRYYLLGNDLPHFVDAAGTTGLEKAACRIAHV
jgi:hypothetical protein